MGETTKFLKKVLEFRILLLSLQYQTKEMEDKTMTKDITKREELIDLLKSIKGGTMVYLTTATTLKINDWRIRGKVIKFCQQSIQVGASYERSVNHRLEKIGLSRIFKADSLPYGRWYIPNRVIKFNGNYLARFYKTANANEKIIYFVNGRIANARESELISRYDTSVYSSKQARFGLRSHQVEIRNYYLENILSISANGNVYNINIARTSKSYSKR